MAQKSKTLFEAIVGSGGVRFIGDMALVVMPMGNGAIITPKDAYLQTKKWADGKADSMNVARNIELFCGQLDVYVARMSSALPTKGHSSILIKMAKAMQSNGMDLEEWSFPKDVVMEMMPEHLKAKVPAPKKAPEPADTSDDS